MPAYDVSDFDRYFGSSWGGIDYNTSYLTALKESQKYVITEQMTKFEIMGFHPTSSSLNWVTHCCFADKSQLKYSRNLGYSGEVFMCYPNGIIFGLVILNRAYLKEVLDK